MPKFPTFPSLDFSALDARKLADLDDKLVSLARDADLVVHECTYANRDAALGEQWKHSTPADAAWVATTAGARRLLINHFSSRYDDPNELITEARSDFESTIAANELEPVDIPRC